MNIKPCKSSLVFSTIAAALLVFTSNAPAYNVGDTVDKDILQLLNVDDKKITMIDFFASWCVSCRIELPLLNAMKLDSQKAMLVGVSTDEDLALGKAFQSELGLTFPVYDDVKQSVVSRFAPKGMPAIYYVQGGKVVNVRFGAIHNIANVVKRDIERISK